MFEKDDKKRLYWLIDQYLSGAITGRTFCDEYYYCYSLELDHSILTDLEKESFAVLGKVCSRFSEFREDHLALPNGFYTEEQLRQRISDTKDQLQTQRPI